ncbi:MAG: ATP-binding protein [Methermicoccaceae archaeon]
MKVLVCGKGGSGKSTLTSLLAGELARRGQKVLVIDGDESNYGLHALLGLELPPDLLGYFGGKKGVSAALLGKGDAVEEFERGWKQFRREKPKPSIDDIPSELLSEGDGIKLVSIGKIRRFGEGCACPMGALLRELLTNLETGEGEVVLVDTDAGIEHFGRAVEQGADIVLVVVEPSYESIGLSHRIAELCRAAGKPAYIVLNKVDEHTRDVLLEHLDAESVIGELPMSRELFSAGLAGRRCIDGGEPVKRVADALLG